MKKFKIIIAVVLCVLALVSVAAAGWLVYSTVKANIDSEEALSPASETEAELPEETEQTEYYIQDEDSGMISYEEAVEEEYVPENAREPEPETEEVKAEGYSPLYCTVWPVRELNIYASADTNKKNIIGKTKACNMYTVIGEDTDKKLFEIRIGPENSGFIDSNYCMINLPEYIGDLCAYDITNSYDSLYMIHEYELPGITGNVIPGYEDVRLADGSFLVPFLYPSVPKLIAAAQKALDMGYRIRICDSYRPRIATNYIYNMAMAVINNPLPQNTYTGKTVELPPPQHIEGVPDHTVVIYQDLVSLNGWKLSSFLAAGASNHNRGIALDLTFEDAATGEEIPAQTRMHDLSAYSTIRTNNKAAGDIYNVLTGFKLMSIVSEWWHFQDNATMKSLNLPFCEKGVSAEGWIEDAGGIGYRLADGTRLSNAMFVLEDGCYTFDEAGHLTD